MGVKIKYNTIYSENKKILYYVKKKNPDFLSNQYWSFTSSTISSKDRVPVGRRKKSATCPLNFKFNFLQALKI